MNRQQDSTIRWVGLTLAVLVLSSLACTVGLLKPPGSSTSSEVIVSTAGTPTALPPEFLAQADAEELLLVNVYQRVNPSVVNIDVSAADYDGELADLGSGSGFVYDAEGHVVTNNHVVVDVQALRVTLSDGAVFEAEIIGADDYADLAVLKLDAPQSYEFLPVEMGDSSVIQVGQRVIAIGSPFGLAGSMTVGIVSGVGRTLPSEVIASDGGIFSNPLIIQTDAAINPGNSGGPLLNSSGQVIGVNVAIRSSTGVNSGIGFAIPANTVERIVPQLIENGKAEYPYLGVSSKATLSLAELAIEFDLPVTQGVLIESVTKGSGADKAGLRGGDHTENFRGGEVSLGGDIIIAMDGFPINNFDELLAYIVTNTSVGQTVNVTIIRDGKRMDIPVTLGSRSD